MPEEARHCNPSLPVEMEDDANKMRGDAIGNTLYSERWVIKVLMKLTKFCSEDWSEDMEAELCLLWDMTIEPDVVALLMQHNFLDLTCHIIHYSSIPRLMEILIGIVGNMSCISSVRMEIARKVNIIHMLLELLSLPDVPSLLQLMRLLQACFWDLRNTEATSTSSVTPVDQTALHGNKSRSVPKPEGMVTAHSKLDISPSCKLRVDEKQHASYNCNTDVKKLEHVHSLSVGKPVPHNALDEVSQHFQSCVVGLEESSLNTCTLDEPDQKKNPQADCENDNMSDRNEDKQLQLNEDAKKESNEVDSVWLHQLCDVNKWLPNIIYILRNSTNEELIRSALALLDTLCYVPINNDLLGRYIASPDVVLGLLEALEQLHHECNKDDDLCPNVELEKAVYHWGAVLYTFTLFPEGKVALGSHAEALGTSLYSHLIVGKLPSQLNKHQVAFVMFSTAVMSSLLEDVGYFHPPTFNCFLSIYTFLRGSSSVERNRYNEDGEEKVVSRFSKWEVQQEVIGNLEKYFVAIVQWADGELVRVLQHCNEEHVAILQSVMEAHKST